MGTSDFRNKVFIVLRAMYPMATTLKVYSHKIFGKRYCIVDRDFNIQDITTEFTEICKTIALDELIRVIEKDWDIEVTTERP